MPLTTAGLNTSVDAVAAAYNYLALYDGDPVGAGTEITGGSPAYARQLAAFDAAAAGVKDMTGTETFDIPAGATVSHFAWFTAVTAGTMGSYGAFAASEGPYGAQGTYEVTAADITAT